MVQQFLNRCCGHCRLSHRLPPGRCRGWSPTVHWELKGQQALAVWRHHSRWGWRVPQGCWMRWEAVQESCQCPSDNADILTLGSVQCPSLEALACRAWTPRGGRGSRHGRSSTDAEPRFISLYHMWLLRWVHSAQRLTGSRSSFCLSGGQR